ncbi:MAG: zinc-ribbon domain containing protein [Deltaproteobacteria bacterium]|nr:zinc-ribbon domain containing protein [Deltaproteobacteria bacterium]
MEFQDRQLTCIDCGESFLFSAGEQEFYAKKGFKEEPKRCRPCREARKVKRGPAGSSGTAAAGGRAMGMRSANRGMGDDEGHGNQVPSRDDHDEDNIGNRLPPSRGPMEPRDFGGPRGAAGTSRGPREMHEATCAQCGGVARVPFRPVPGRPVYCRDCYGGRGAAG